VRARRQLATAIVLGLFAIGIGACGDDEETAGTTVTTEQRTDSTTETTPTTETAPESTADADDDSPSGGLTAPSKDSGEDTPAGAGDEVPASSQALITGRDGGLHPTVVHVPPFIAVRVQLVSQDGIEYELEGAGHKVKAGGEIRSASTLLDGLRAGERVVLTGPQGKVTIEANAEPGP
jgi:hypothetical protein